MKTKHITEAVMHAVFFTCGMLAIAFVTLISLYIITAGRKELWKSKFARLVKPSKSRLKN